MHLASWYNSTISLLKNKGANRRIKDFNGNTPLHCAILQKDLNKVKKLLFSEVIARNNIPQREERFITNENQRLIFSYFISHFRILLSILIKNDIFDIQELLCFIDGVDVQNNEGKTPLHLAWNEDIIKILQNHGANETIKDIMGNTPLHCALLEKNMDKVKALISPNTINLRKNLTHQTPLHLAWNEEVVIILQDKGANEMLINISGDTPLHCALKEKNIRKVKALTSRLNIHMKNFEEKTPLDLAWNNESFYFLKIASANMQQNNNFTSEEIQKIEEAQRTSAAIKRLRKSYDDIGNRFLDHMKAIETKYSFLFKR